MNKGFLLVFLGLILLSTAFAVDYTYEEQYLQNNDGFCYNNFAEHGVTPPSIDPDDDNDCCFGYGPGWGTACHAGGCSWAGAGGMHNCCGDDLIEQHGQTGWVAPGVACYAGVAYFDEDDAREACTLAKGTWVGGRGEKNCCDKGVLDGAVDSWINDADQPGVTVVYGTEGVCDNGYWYKGGNCLDYEDCINIYCGTTCNTIGVCAEGQVIPGKNGCCAGDNLKVYACNSARTCYVKSSSCYHHPPPGSGPSCAECCQNGHCYYAAGDLTVNKKQYFDVPGHSGYGLDYYYVCDYPQNLNGLADVDTCWGLPDIESANIPDATVNVGPKQVSKGTDPACSNPGCLWCGYRCYYSLNPNKCITTLARNKCTVTAEVAAESQLECVYYPDLDSQVTYTEGIGYNIYGQPFQTGICTGHVDYTGSDIKYDASGAYDCDKTYTTGNKWRSAWGCAFGYYDDGYYCDTFTWGSTYEQVSYSCNVLCNWKCDTCYDICWKSCCYWCQWFCNCKMVDTIGCCPCRGWFCSTECGQCQASVCKVCSGVSCPNCGSFPCTYNCNPHDCWCRYRDFCPSTCYKNKVCYSDADCSTGYKCYKGILSIDGRCRAFTWNQNYQTYTAYFKKRCNDYFVYNDSNNIPDEKYTVIDTSWTYIGFNAFAKGVYDGLPSIAWNYNLK